MVGSRAMFQRDIDVTLTPVSGGKRQEPSVGVRVDLSGHGLPAPGGCWEILHVLEGTLCSARGVPAEIATGKAFPGLPSPSGNC